MLRLVALARRPTLVGGVMATTMSSMRQWRPHAFLLPVIIAAFLLAPRAADATPGFARQTGVACEACHTVFPELTPFGRLFKLNGYVFSNVRQIQDISVNRETTLALAEAAPLSLQLEASNTTLAKSIPDAAAADVSQKNTTQFPQALSLFYTGKIADNLGAFIQLTWSPATNSVGIDNSDLRFADHGAFPSVGVPDFIYGLTLNNNPTSQDVWNSTPAWGYPFITTIAGIPTNAKAQIDGTLAQTSAGLGGYLWINNHLYIEVDGYRSAQTGTKNSVTGNIGPLDSTTPNRINGVAPYWRVGWEQDWQRNSFFIGTFGLRDVTHPAGIGEHGPADTFTDIGFDAQYQYIGDNHIFSIYATWIHEHQNRNTANGTAVNATDRLDTARLTGSYFYNRKIGGSVQIFSTTGTSDPGLFVAAPVIGSAAGKPDTQGAIFELDYLPWLNTKLGVQYTAFRKFNGATSNYDGFGRNASDNNTLFVFVWTAF
jgi:hypothetical protein